MKIAIATFSFVASVLTAISCSKNDSNDNSTPNQNQNQNQAGNPTPSPTPTPAPIPFGWHSVTFEDASKLQGPMADPCMNHVRFTVFQDGSFTATENCSNTKQSGHIKDDERTALDNLMNNISLSEAQAPLKCKTPGSGDPTDYLNISMRSDAMQTYILLKQSAQSICTSGDPADVDRLKQDLYQLKSLYVKTQ